MSELKIGDTVRFSPQAIRKWEIEDNPWYEDCGLTVRDTLIIIKESRFGKSWLVKCLRNGAIVSLSKERFVLAEYVDPQQAIIAKIKYLNKRYKDRKHVRI